MDISQTIAKRLCTLRKGTGLSQAAFAKKLHTNSSSIGRYELAKTAVPPEILLSYAEYFSISMDYLYGRTDDPHGQHYDAIPKEVKESPEMRQLVEMCFDPDSPMCEQLKSSLVQMLSKEKEADVK